MKRFSTAVALVFCALVSAGFCADERPNVLFIAVDDLRPELGCYGETHIHSPNIDRLAATGVLFERAYCMVPTCGASRASLMTGIRPSRNRFVNYLAWAEKDAPGITTLNTQFRRNGYYTVSLGKVFHHPTDNAAGWSEPAWRPQGVPTYRDPASIRRQRERAREPGNAQRKRGPAYESADVPDNAYADGVVAERAIADLQRLSKRDEPFFLAVGFFKPHLPFVAPSKYWKLYDHDEIHLPETYHVPENAPAEAIHNFGELRAYADIPPQGPVSDEQARNLIHGYYACVSYTDAQIGKLLDELERLEIDDNTIVILWGDHGWNLGEHTLWCKHCCFETSLHVPLLIRGPNVPAGQRTAGLTEFIDIYPSLCELAGLPQPDHLQGRSFVPLLQNPELAWKPAAISRYRAGDSIRTADFRYTEYSTEGGELRARMLYDHQHDPQEDHNISEQPDARTTVRELSQQLQEGMGRDAQTAQ